MVIIILILCWRILPNSLSLSSRLHYNEGYTWQIPKTRSFTWL